MTSEPSGSEFETSEPKVSDMGTRLMNDLISTRWSTLQPLSREGTGDGNASGDKVEVMNRIPKTTPGMSSGNRNKATFCQDDRVPLDDPHLSPMAGSPDQRSKDVH